MNNLLKKLKEASVFKPPTPSDIEARREELIAKNKGVWKAKAYHKRAYFEADIMDDLYDQVTKKLRQDLKANKVDEKYPFKVKVPEVRISADQCSGSVISPSGSRYFMDVNWEVISEEVKDVTLEGVVSLHTTNTAHVKELLDTLDEDGLSELLHFYGDADTIKCDAFDKYYAKEGPAMFKEWLVGEQQVPERAIQKIEVEYTGEVPQME